MASFLLLAKIQKKTKPQTFALKILHLLFSKDDVHERRYIGYGYLPIAIRVAEFRKVKLFNGFLRITIAFFSGKDADANSSCQKDFVSNMLIIRVNETDLRHELNPISCARKAKLLAM